VAAIEHQLSKRTVILCSSLNGSSQLTSDIYWLLASTEVDKWLHADYRQLRLICCHPEAAGLRLPTLSSGKPTTTRP